MDEGTRKRKRAIIWQWVIICVGLVLAYFLVFPFLILIIANETLDKGPEWVIDVLSMPLGPLDYFYDNDVLGYRQYIDWLREFLEN